MQADAFQCEGYFISCRSFTQLIDFVREVDFQFDLNILAQRKQHHMEVTDSLSGPEIG